MRRDWVGLVFILVSVALAACSGLNLSKTRSSRHSTQFATIENSPASVWRPTQKDSIPVQITPQVKNWVNLFNGKLKPHFDRWFYRIGQYGPTIEKILDKEGVPRDLIYLAMIESGFNLKARSHASAVGPWQFIGSTGRMYGLKSDFFVDDRSDLITATRAAARHLKDLYNTFGDWYLAFAAYNAGPGTVNRAIRGTRSKNYWVHARSRYLRAETKNYVPKILAALHIVKNYRKYGYSEKDFGKPMQYDRVFIPDATDITVIAKSAGTSVDVIQELNPALVSGITRPGTRVPVYIPKGRKEVFKSRYADIPHDKRVENLYHRVGQRESLHSIAKTYNTTAIKLARTNHISDNSRPTPGTSLKIPTNKKVLLALAEGSSRSYPSSSGTKYYRVRRGDTLSLIARRNRMSLGTLARLNRISTRSNIRIGQTLKIRGGSIASGPVYAGLSPVPSASRRTSGVAYIIQQEKVDPTSTLTTAAPETDSFFYADISSEDKATGFSPSRPTPDIANIIAMNDSSSQARRDNLPGVVHVGDETDSSDLSDIPGAIALSSPKIKKTSPKFHTVRRGETLGKIANRYRVGVGQLKALNHLRGDRIRINQRLLVSQVHYSSPVNTTRAQLSRQFISHRIRSGDTLWSLSKQYGVTIGDIKRWNQLRTNNLKVNQKVRIQPKKKQQSRNGVALTL